MSTVYLLTGDIGGTNSRLSLYAVDAKEPLVTKNYRNAQYVLEHVDDPAAFGRYIVGPFLEFCSDQAKLCASFRVVACLATAGVVKDNQVRLTNLGNLLIDGNALQASKDGWLQHIVACQIINDFVAQGYGCLTLQPHEVKQLNGPKVDLSAVQGPKVCVGAGTGLGECYLTPSEGSYACFPSEGGHVEFAPRNSLGVRLWQSLMTKFASRNRISVERVVSGKGLANVYEFLAEEYPDRIDKLVHAEFVAAGDEQGRVVGENARTKGSLCELAMCVMMSAYGAEVGSCAIKWIPSGGLFVTGGLTPKNLDFIEGLDSDFMKAYLDKGRVSPLLDKIPLFAVLTEDLGVRGARFAAGLLYQHESCKEPTGKDDDAWKLYAAAAGGVVAGWALGKWRRS